MECNISKNKRALNCISISNIEVYISLRPDYSLRYCNAVLRDFVLLSLYAAMLTSLGYAVRILFMKFSRSIPNSRHPEAQEINM
jgi:hypothetical protein